MKAQKTYKIRCFQQIDSTNTYAMKNLDSLCDKEVITAGIQTAGKGRLNREWVSDGQDNVYLSVVLKPCDSIHKNLPLANLTQYMSVIVCKVVEKYRVSASIKWPNDVLVNGKKIAGILSQASIQGNRLKGLVLGIGVNLNLTREAINKIDQPATALNLEIGRSVNKQPLIEELLDSFFENYELFLKTGFSLIERDYITRSDFLGKEITVNSLDKISTGVAKGFTQDGALVLVGEDSQEKIITMGDVTCS